MDRKECRARLWRWGGTTRYCKARQQEIEEYRLLIESAAGLQAKPLTGMPFGGTVGDPSQRAAEKLAYLRDKYEARIDDLIEDVQTRLEEAWQVEEALRVLDQQELVIIRNKYELRMNAAKAADAAGYTVDGLKSAERRAVDKVRRALDKEKAG